ncbi:MAG: hypothetical protein U1D55_18405 [Phycisphaerae bacterium]
MPILLDGKPFAVDAGAGDSLRDVIDRVRSRQPTERLIVSVAINGREIPETELPAAMQNCVNEADRIELASGALRDVAGEALRSVAAELRRAGAAQANVAAELQAGRVQEGLRRVGQDVALWQSCRQAIVDASELLGRDLLAERIDGQPVSALMDDLVGRLTELRDTFQANDLITLADLVAHEWPPVYERWAEAFDAIADALDRGD